MENTAPLVLGAVLVGLGLLTHMAFAVGVAVDAAASESQGRDLLLAPRWAWVSAAFLGGPFAATLYWLVNCSRLRPRAEADAPAKPDALDELFDTPSSRKGRAKRSRSKSREG